MLTVFISMSQSLPHKSEVHMIWLKHFQFHLACLLPLEIVHVTVLQDPCFTCASDPGFLSIFVLPV